MHDQNHNECPKLALLVSHMSEKGYRRRVIDNYKTIARQFLCYLRHIKISVDAVQSEHVQRFLRRRLSKYKLRNGRSPSNSQSWCAREGAAVHMLLRVLRGHWPPSPIPLSDPEIMLDEILRSYEQWMCEVRGLCHSTRENRIAEALRFMNSLRIQDRAAWSDDVSISGIDAYVTSRAVARRTRGSLKVATIDLRSFLRYLKIAMRSRAWRNHMTSQEYLTPTEAAECLRSSKSMLAKRRLVGSGPPFVRIGRAIRYRRRDLDTWMSSTLNSHATRTVR